MIKLNLKEQLLDRIQEFVKSNRLLTPSVVVLTSVEADEYKALTLFSDNMRLASEGLQLTQQQGKRIKMSGRKNHIFPELIA